MKKLETQLSIILLGIILSTTAVYSTELKEADKIKSIIIEYESALNQHNIDKILNLFSSDAVLVLQQMPTTQGTEKIKSAYNNLFKMLEFNLTFTIQELVFISEEWAFIRTITTGQTKMKSNNKENEANGHEIFILKKIDNDGWKIFRYAGCSSI